LAGKFILICFEVQRLGNQVKKIETVFVK